jgi:Flp pilus assembly protein CpaB
MTERVRNIVIAVVLAGTAVLLTGLYVTNYQRHVRQGEEHKTVFVAARDIPAGTSAADALAHQMLAPKVVTRSAVVPGAISNASQLAGTVANQPIYVGEQVTTSRFSDTAVTGIQGQLKGTMRAVQLQGDANQLLAGTLRAGDHVDLLATFKYTVVHASQDTSQTTSDGGSFATRTVLRNIFVLRTSLGEATSKLASGGSGNVILRLTDAQAQKLDFTINVATRGGDYNPTWRLTLRSPVNAQDSPESLTASESVLLDGLSPQQRARLDGKYRVGQ